MKIKRNTWKERQALKLRKHRRETERRLATACETLENAVKTFAEARKLKEKWMHVEIAHGRGAMMGNRLSLRLEFCESMFGMRRVSDSIDWKKEILEEVSRALQSEFNFREEPRHRHDLNFNDSYDFRSQRW